MTGPPVEIGQPPRPPTGTLENIQALRALACSLVVFAHLDRYLHPLGLPPFGHGGVDLFFVISGLIMVRTTLNRRLSPLEFLRNRFIRIAPLYWLITLAVFGLSLLAPHLLGHTRPNPVELVKSLLFIPFQKQGGLYQPVLFLGWTLNYEMFFYALFALGLAFPRRTTGVVGVAAAMVGLFVLGCIVPPTGGVFAFYSDSMLLEFVAGMGIGLAFDRIPAASSPGARAFAFGILSVALVALLSLPFLLDWPRAAEQGSFAVLVVVAAVSLERAGCQATWPPVRLLGDASYSIYLTHAFVTVAAQKLLPPPTHGMGLPVVLLALTLLLVWGVGIATYAGIEKPATARAKGWLGGSRGGTTTLAARN